MDATEIEKRCDLFRAALTLVPSEEILGMDVDFQGYPLAVRIRWRAFSHIFQRRQAFVKYQINGDICYSIEHDEVVYTSVRTAGEKSSRPLNSELQIVYPQPTP